MHAWLFILNSVYTWTFNRSTWCSPAQRAWLVMIKEDAELYLEWAWLWGRGRYTAQCTELHLLSSSCLMWRRLLNPSFLAFLQSPCWQPWIGNTWNENMSHMEWKFLINIMLVMVRCYVSCIIYKCYFLPLIPHFQRVSFLAVFLVRQIHGFAGTRKPQFLAAGH